MSVSQVSGCECTNSGLSVSLIWLTYCRGHSNNSARSYAVFFASSNESDRTREVLARGSMASAVRMPVQREAHNGEIQYDSRAGMPLG